MLPAIVGEAVVLQLSFEGLVLALLWKVLGKDARFKRLDVVYLEAFATWSPRNDTRLAVDVHVVYLIKEGMKTEGKCTLYHFDLFVCCELVL